jgi:arginase
LGTQLGPSCLKTEYLYNNLKNLGCEVVDFDVIKDMPIINDKLKYHNTKNFVEVGKVNEKVSSILIICLNKQYLYSEKILKKLAHSVCSAIENDFVPIILGGDHSLAIGSVYGSSSALSKIHGDPTIMGSGMGLIWIDAHADINTPLTSSTGNLHGQPVSFILHELDKYLPGLQGFEWNLSCLPARNLVYIGLRDIDPAET